MRAAPSTSGWETRRWQGPRRGSRSDRTRVGESGFTLAELLVTVVILSVVLVAALALFDFNNQLTRVQTAVADMQQSMRIAQLDMVRLVRMAGRGGLNARIPGQTLPNGLAISVRNNVAPGTEIGDGSTPSVVPGTDILTVRGVFNSPLYQLLVEDPNTFTLIEGSSEGRIRVRNVSPPGIPQDLTDLAEAIEGVNGASPVPEGLLLSSPLDDSIFGVVELIPGSSTVNRSGGVVTDIVLAFSYADAGLADRYKQLNGDVFPGRLNSAISVGILEEHRFYVRQDFAIAGDPTSDWQPKLSRARVFPGTDVAYKNDADNWSIDIADNIFDLQVSLGLDTNGDGTVPDNGDANDDWLFNATGDSPADSKWNVVSGALPARPTPLFYVRLTTLARTDQRDRRYQAPVLNLVEDHDYSVTPSDRFNTGPERMYRRRQLQTVVDLRNL